MPSIDLVDLSIIDGFFLLGDCPCYPLTMNLVGWYPFSLVSDSMLDLSMDLPSLDVPCCLLFNSVLGINRAPRMLYGNMSVLSNYRFMSLLGSVYHMVPSNMSVVALMDSSFLDPCVVYRMINNPFSVFPLG